MEGEPPSVSLPSSSAGPGGVVTAPRGNLYLMEIDDSGTGDADTTGDLPPEEQQHDDIQPEEHLHDDQDVELGQSPTADDEQSTQIPVDEPQVQPDPGSIGPTTATFRRDPNLPRGEARQTLLKEINQSHEAGQFYVDVVPPLRVHNIDLLFIRFVKEKWMSMPFLDQVVSGTTVTSAGLRLPWTLLEEFAQKSLPGTKPDHRTSRSLLKKKDFVAETIRSKLWASIMA
jgi:hypothetical protein